LDPKAAKGFVLGSLSYRRVLAVRTVEKLEGAKAEAEADVAGQSVAANSDWRNYATRVAHELLRSAEVAEDEDDDEDIDE